ncbi:MAG: class I tRNA ligase family protein, partial [Coriobacteriales bacterium]|nr:class I tRNA ligase family protein [Coriobacteriales bacterium]
WSQEGLEGIYRTCSRFWKIVHDLVGQAGEETLFNPSSMPSESRNGQSESLNEQSDPSRSESSATRKAELAATLWRERHRVTGKVERDFNRYNFNTAIAALMELNNAASAYLQAWSAAERLADTQTAAACRELAQTITLLLAPMAPHLAEELWQTVLGNSGSVHEQAWPSYDEELARPEEIEYAIQINGKVKAKLTVAIDADEDEIRGLALEALTKQLANQEIKQVIIVAGRLVNVVI